MTVEKKSKVIGLIVFTSSCLIGCSGYQESGNDGMVEKKQTDFSSMEIQSSDSVLLTKFNYEIEGGDVEKAKIHASQLSFPKGRAMAFLRIVVKGKETIDKSNCKKEALNNAIQNLNSVSDLEVKFALQQEFLTALFDLDPKHKQKIINEIYAGILDNFWETSTALETNVMELSSATISMINELLNKSWNIEVSHLKKLGLEGKIHTAKLRYPLNPEKSLTEISMIKDQVWGITPSSKRIPFLLDLIEFELDVTQDISEVKRLIKTLKKTIDMGIDV